MRRASRSLPSCCGSRRTTLAHRLQRARQSDSLSRRTMSTALAIRGSGRWSRDLVALTKPRVTALVMATAAVGMGLAPGRIALVKALAMFGTTALLVGSANALNCWLERDTDVFMQRTRKRPLPARPARPAARVLVRDRARAAVAAAADAGDQPDDRAARRAVAVELRLALHADEVPQPARDDRRRGAGRAAAADGLDRGHRPASARAGCRCSRSCSCGRCRT